MTEEERWVEAERERVIAYLAREGVDHGEVGEWPAFHVDPYLAIWAIESKRRPGAIGWWVVSGDGPTDAISSKGQIDHPRLAMQAFARQWSDIADHMERGVAHPAIKVGEPDQWPMLAPILRARAKILAKWADDESIWVEDDE